MSTPRILCIGSVHWDLIGRVAGRLPAGGDLPGVIERHPGGVAGNVALALGRAGLVPVLLSSLGREAEGEALVAACASAGADTRFLHRGALTDRYLAIEAEGALVAAVADGRALEAAGPALLAPLRDGRLPRPWEGIALIDGNLPSALLAELEAEPALLPARLRLAAASPARATNLVPLMRRPASLFCLNRAEAEAICGRALSTARAAAEAMLAAGAARVLVTDGAASVAEGCRERGILEARPPAVALRRSTGAGDALLAAHLAAECRGAPREEALQAALAAAAAHVSGEDPP